jgi:hypothetical protein
VLGERFGKAGHLIVEQRSEALRRRQAEQRGLPFAFLQETLELRAAKRIAGAQLLDAGGSPLRRNVEQRVDECNQLRPVAGRWRRRPP